jgi:hypothetical protein
MLFVDSLSRIHSRQPLQRSFAILTLMATGLVATTSIAWSQTGGGNSASVAPKVQSSTPQTVVKPSGPQWRELSGAQQQTLRPLAGTWDSLSEGHKGKWIALAQNYPSIAPAEQVKLQGRMAEWAALKPREREQARLNFAETKKLSPSERTADWEIYQALSPEEKKKLAAEASAKPKGAAIRIKPAPSERLTTVPITRHTPAQERTQLAPSQTLDRNTLLPQPTRQAPGTSPATSATQN